MVYWGFLPEAGMAIVTTIVADEIVCAIKGKAKRPRALIKK
jgi:hypothetical protein